MAIAGRQLALSPPVVVGRTVGTGTQDDGANPSFVQVQRGEINLDNVLKLIPGEVVAPFIAGSGVGVPFSVDYPWLWPSIVFAICFIICGFLRAVASKPVDQTAIWKNVNWPLVWVSLGAFFIWAHAVSVSLPLAAYLPPAAWGFFAMIYGIVAPHLVPVR